MSRLPVQIAHQLELAPQAESWLIEKLWSEQAVGIIGGEPKCCKSFLALDMELSTALQKYGDVCGGPMRPTPSGSPLPLVSP